MTCKGNSLPIEIDIFKIPVLTYKDRITIRCGINAGLDSLVITGNMYELCFSFRHYNNVCEEDSKYNGESEFVGHDN